MTASEILRDSRFIIKHIGFSYLTFNDGIICYIESINESNYMILLSDNSSTYVCSVCGIDEFIDKHGGLNVRESISEIDSLLESIPAICEF